MENTTETALAVSSESSPSLNLFSLDMFREAWKVAEQLAKSKLIPKDFQNNPPDCIIAMEMAQRIGASIFSVMQSLYIVHGRPGWAAQVIIAALNSCGRFSPLRFDITGDGDARTCMAWALEKGSSEKLTGPPVSIKTAKDEGWYQKNGSKWQTMPELMLRYRAATFFGRLYAPDILMGMRTAEELRDSDDVIDVIPTESVAESLNKRFSGKVEKIDTVTGEVLSEDTEPDTPPRHDEIKETIPTQNDSDKPTVKESLTVQDQQSAYDPSSDIKTKSFIKELMAKATSFEVDQWRMKHSNRVANTFGGVESPGYLYIMDLANLRFAELEDSEKQQGSTEA